MPGGGIGIPGTGEPKPGTGGRPSMLQNHHISKNAKIRPIRKLTRGAVGTCQAEA